MATSFKAKNESTIGTIAIFVLLVLVLFGVPFLAVSAESARSRKEKMTRLGATNTAAFEYSYSAWKRASDNKWILIGRKVTFYGGFKDAGYMIVSMPVTSALTVESATGFDTKEAATDFYNLPYTDSPANKVFMEMKTDAFPTSLSR